MPAENTGATEQVLHLIAIREEVGPDQSYGRDLARAVEGAMAGEPLAVGALTTVTSELGANHHGHLRQIGFDFATANSLITVVTEEVES